jgi:CRP-like cAMP-binding protein
MNLQKLQSMNIPTVRIPAGETVLEEGKPGGCVYVLIHGATSCRVDGYEVGQLDTPGTILGEISALLRRDCTATVVTATDSEFYVIDDLPRLMEADPQMALQVAQVLAVRLVNMNNHFVEVKKVIGELHARLERYLPVFRRAE